MCRCFLEKHSSTCASSVVAVKRTERHDMCCVACARVCVRERNGRCTVSVRSQRPRTMFEQNSYAEIFVILFSLAMKYVSSLC